VAEGPGWITEPPPKWARELLPEMREAEEKWGAGQRYEAFCMLYVALTRSKRGLYVLLEPPAKSQDVDKPSLANWLATSLESNGEPGIIYQDGSPAWTHGIPPLEEKAVTAEPPSLGSAIPRRDRTTPSGAKKKDGAVSHSAGGMIFGTEVHAAFEDVGWVDAPPPNLPETDAGDLVRTILQIPPLRAFFERGGRSIELFREQAIDATLDGKWLTGIIDRLHLHRDAQGTVTWVEVIDFKTDAISDLQELSDKYSGQMNAYRAVMAVAYPHASVDCILISTRLRGFIAL
jgi:ATP-dependent exoDNAse (exonuclease V) beta subunit